MDSGRVFGGFGVYMTSGYATVLLTILIRAILNNGQPDHWLKWVNNQNIIIANCKKEEQSVPQDSNINDMVYLIALLGHVLWTKKNIVCFLGPKDHVLWTKKNQAYFLGLKDHVLWTKKNMVDFFVLL